MSITRSVSPAPPRTTPDTTAPGTRCTARKTIRRMRPKARQMPPAMLLDLDLARSADGTDSGADGICCHQFCVVGFLLCGIPPPSGGDSTMVVVPGAGGGGSGGAGGGQLVGGLHCLASVWADGPDCAAASGWAAVSGWEVGPVADATA